MEKYNRDNTLITKENKKYGFLKSLDLMEMLFSDDPTATKAVAEDK